MKWYQSVAVKSFVIAFISTHVPLLVLIGVITLHPQWLTPWGVFGATLAATLLATALVLISLWRLFRPLRAAADGLLAFMARGESVRLSAGAQDEVGRLVRLLVQALAHLGRARAPLLQSGASMLVSTQSGATGGARDRPVLVLAEIDDWATIEGAGEPFLMQELQATLMRRTGEAVAPEGLVLAWGRGRCLVMLPAPASDALDRLAALSQPLHVSSRPTPYRVSAVMELRSPGPAGWAAALNRLEQRLFALRAGLGEASVV